MPTPEVVINEAVISRAAALAATGASVGQIATELAISKWHTKKIMAHPDFKAKVKEIGDAAVTNAKQMIRSQTSELAAEVARVLKERLEDNDLEAVKVALKVIGFEAEEKTAGDTNIQVVLPGASRVEQTVDSQYEAIGEVEDEQPN